MMQQIFYQTFRVNDCGRLRRLEKVDKPSNLVLYLVSTAGRG